jgi:predicted metal-dependent hydrolase
MRIVRNGDVHVSVPFGMPKREVEAFICQHRHWIDGARKRTAERQKQRADFYNRLPLATKAQKAEATEKVGMLAGPMIERYSKLMGVRPSAVSYKPMISRWGVCNVRERSICYSTYLLLLPDWCVEHVVVHELCHLLEPSHNAHFHELMDKYYPRWREARKETRRITMETPDQ